MTEGHPDKICDQISDGILDALLAIDPNSRCACETTAEPGAVHIMGEITTAATVNYIEIARRIIREIGYTKPEYGFDADTCEISCSLHTQSADIAQGVDMALEAKEAIDTDGLGAGDQGMMFGFACDETPERMPLPITLAHRITRRLAAVRKNGELSYLRPDGKAQVTVEYENGKPVRVNTVVLSTQHDEDADPLTLRQDMIDRRFFRRVSSSGCSKPCSMGTWFRHRRFNKTTSKFLWSSRTKTNIWTSFKVWTSSICIIT